MNRRLKFAWLVLAWPAMTLFFQSNDFPILKGPYLGQKPPGMTPELFAPGIVSTCLQELNSVFSPDGLEFYFCVRTMGASSLFVMKCVEGVWAPARNMGKGINSLGPEFGTVLSPDGKFLFFTRPWPPRVVRKADTALTYDDYLKMHNSPDNGSTNIWWVNAKIIEKLKPGRTK